MNKKNKEERLQKSSKLVAKLNEIIGQESYKVMSQRQLAAQIGFTNAEVSRWLSGERAISLEYALEICDLLNLDKNEYLSDFEISFINDEMITKESQEELKRIYILNDIISKLSEENVTRLFEYIDYLMYLQNEEKSENKLVRKFNR